MGHGFGRDLFTLQILLLNRLAFLAHNFLAHPLRPVSDGAGVLRSVDRQQLGQHRVLTLDSAYEYTDADLDQWDADGSGSTFRKHYPEYYDLALSYGLDPAVKPHRLDISETVRVLGYQPTYSLERLLLELAAYGDTGPPH